MEKLCFPLLVSWLVMEAIVQSVIYSDLKGLLACKGDTVTSLKVEKRTKNHILMIGGVDYKISVESDDSMCKYLKSHCHAIQADTSLYINCERLCYKKFRFGGWCVPALCIGDHIYFSAIPLGSVAAGSDATMDVMLGGKFDDATVTPALISERAYYEIDPKTNKVGSAGKKRIRELLEGYPSWKTAYLNENSESAKVTDEYLRLLKAGEE